MRQDLHDLSILGAPNEQICGIFIKECDVKYYFNLRDTAHKIRHILIAISGKLNQSYTQRVTRIH